MSEFIDQHRRALLAGVGLAGAAAVAACNQQTTPPATTAPAADQPASDADPTPTEADLAVRPAPKSADFPLFLEEHRSDDDTPIEKIWVDPAATLSPSYITTRARYEPRIGNFGEQLLEVAQQFVGLARGRDDDRIRPMLKLYDLDIRDSSGTPIPFCAAGVSYCAAIAYRRQQNIEGDLTTGTLQALMGDIERYHFYPSCSVQDLTYVARGKRLWRSERQSPSPEPGWLAVFDFGMNRPSHVAIVESATPTRLNTIEFNTRNPSGTGDERNGGAITRRERPRGRQLLGFVATTLRPPWT